VAGTHDRLGGLRVASGEDDDRRRGERRQVGVAVQHGDPVASRQPDVQQHQVGTLLASDIYRADTVLRLHDVISEMAQP